MNEECLDAMEMAEGRFFLQMKRENLL